MKAILFHVAALATISLVSLESWAADPPGGARPTRPTAGAASGTAVSASAPNGAANKSTPRTAKTAGSLSGPPSASDCAMRRKHYAESQACFAPYRVANGSVRPEAYQRCKDMPDPALTCGPPTVSPGTPNK